MSFLDGNADTDTGSPNFGSSKIIFTGEATIGQRRKVASSSYLQNEIKDLTFTTLKDGLNMAIDWYTNSLKTPN